MSTRHPVRLFFTLACLLLTLPLLPYSPGAGAQDAGAPALRPPTRGTDADFYGIVGRDPWFEWNTDPVRFPNDVNRDALEGQARELAAAGAGWVRVEIRAEHDANAPGGPGYIDYRKFDWFIKECAPKYGLKVLLLLGSGLLDHSTTDPASSFTRINDDENRADGTNNYIRLYTERAKQVADHYGDAVAAYEILNEPNISDILHSESGGKVVEMAPERFGALLTEVYNAIKPSHPRIPLIVGGLLYGFRSQIGTGKADVDYLYVLYRTERVRGFKAARGRFPWDGVASHAYYVGTPRQIIDHYYQLHDVMRNAGDGDNKIWLTEIGIPGTPPSLEPGFLAAKPTKSELDQAGFMRELFTLLRGDARRVIANVFWFKYEDFPFGQGYAELGLVRLPISQRGAYEQPPAPRKPSYAVFQEFANPGSMPTAPESPQGQPADAYFFPETRHAISGAFRQYWEKNGALMRFGYPVTSVFESGGLRVQYFERARFEYHPENKPPYDVELGLLTAYLTQGRNFPRGVEITPTQTPTPRPSPTASPTQTPLSGTPDPRVTPSPSPSPTLTPSPSPTPEPTTAYFPQTGHNLSGAFLQYWKTKGGLASYGFPISEELREVNQADGKEYTVQYFERARFEYHPENAGTDFVVLLGLMGLETVNTGGWYR